ncbi:hypothetical protein D3C74_50890 [compost metagenome]
MPNMKKCSHSGAIIFVPTEDEIKLQNVEDKNKELEARLVEMEKLIKAQSKVQETTKAVKKPKAE